MIAMKGCAVDLVACFEAEELGSAHTEVWVLTLGGCLTPVGVILVYAVHMQHSLAQHVK